MTKFEDEEEERLIKARRDARASAARTAELVGIANEISLKHNGYGVTYQLTEQLQNWALGFHDYSYGADSLATPARQRVEALVACLKELAPDVDERLIKHFVYTSIASISDRIAQGERAQVLKRLQDVGARLSGDELAVVGRPHESWWWEPKRP